MKEKSLSRNWILVSLMFTMMLAAMDATIVSTAIPQIVGDLGGFALFGWVFSVYLLAQTITIPIYGKLADIYGRKPILIWGMIVFLLGSALCAFSYSMMGLILFRAIQGLGAGAMVATINTIAGDIYSVEERGKIQGWLSSVWGMAAIVGPTLGGTFAEYESWRWIFLINLPIGIIAIILLVVHFKEKVVKQKRQIDYPGAILMLIAGTYIIFTLTEGGVLWKWDSLQGVLSILLGAFLIYLIVVVERRSSEPILPLSVWSSKVNLGANLSMLGMGIIMLGPAMYLPVFGQSVLNMNPIAAGLLLASSSIGWPIASSLSAKLYLRIGFRNTSFIGAVVIIVASFAFTLLTSHSSIWMFVAAQVLLGAGFGLLSTPTLVGVQSVVKWESRGVVTGANMFSRYVGQSIGAAIIAGVFNAQLRKELNQASEGLKSSLPQVDDVMATLQSNQASFEVIAYLKNIFLTATHQVYWLMAIVGVFAFLVLTIQPKKFDIVEDDK